MLRQDLVEAYKWINLASAASANGDATIAIIIGEAKLNREKIQKHLTREQLKEAQKRSSDFKPSAKVTP
jgi:hypothetical protein